MRSPSAIVLNCGSTSDRDIACILGGREQDSDFAFEWMMAEYNPIGENGTVDPMETALNENTPRKISLQWDSD